MHPGNGERVAHHFVCLYVMGLYLKRKKQMILNIRLSS